MEHDDAIIAQMEGIADEAKSQPLVAEPSPTEELASSYEDDIFLAKIKTLSRSYTQMRKTRGDGNCFYRAFAYGLLSATEPDEAAALTARCKQVGVETAEAQGYSRFTAEDFFEMWAELLEHVTAGNKASALSQFASDNMTSDYVVTFLRLCTSVYLKARKEEFEPFVETGEPIASFCAREVDPMGRDAGHLQIRALCDVFKVNVRVAYLDRTPGNDPVVHVIPDSAVGAEPPKFTLLYRPGHYDILLSDD